MKKNSPIISVIIPVYNVKNTLIDVLIAYLIKALMRLKLYV